MDARDRRREPQDGSFTPHRGLTVPGMYALFVAALLVVAIVLGALAELQG